MTAARTPSSCPHRCVNDPGGVTCSLLGEMTGVQQHPAMFVEIDACQACCDSFPPSTTDLNPVLASLLHHLTEEIAADGGVDGCDLDRANELNLWAEHSLPAVTPDEDDTVDHSRASHDHLRDITVEQIETYLPRLPRGGPVVKTWAVGVTTSPRRMPTLDSCVGSLLDSGWDNPVLFIDGEVELPKSIAHLESCRRRPALGAFPNYVLSLAELYMRQPHADAYLMIQDDAQLLGTVALREYLEKLLWFEPGPCIASLYCSRKYNRNNPGWHVFPENWVWGAVAFVFSREAVRALLMSDRVYDHRAKPENQGLSKIDVLIGQFSVAEKIPVYFPSPSLVQHIGTISTIWNVARAVNGRRADRFLGDLIEPT